MKEKERRRRKFELKEKKKREEEDLNGYDQIREKKRNELMRSNWRKENNESIQPNSRTKKKKKERAEKKKI